MTTLATVVATEVSDALLEGMARTPLFEGASEDTISRLAAQGVLRRFRRGTYLFHQGDDAPDVYFLVSGRVEISSLSSNGHRQLHTTLDVRSSSGSSVCSAISLDPPPPWLWRTRRCGERVGPYSWTS